VNRSFVLESNINGELVSGQWMIDRSVGSTWLLSEKKQMQCG